MLQRGIKAETDNGEKKWIEQGTEESTWISPVVVRLGFIEKVTLK